MPEMQEEEEILVKSICAALSLTIKIKKEKESLLYQITHFLATLSFKKLKI